MFEIFNKLERVDWVVFFTLLIVCIFSIYNGYLSPDSWDYISLAQSIGMGKGLTIQDQYFAVFPPGYPILIALFSGFSINIYNLITASKILNCVLAFCSYGYAKAIFKDKYVAMFLVLNPMFLQVLAYTWSENLFYMAVLATIYYLIKINTEPTIKNLIKLTFVLFLAISARYFGGIFLFSLFIVYILAYGQNRIFIKVIPFALVGVIFIINQLINRELTGYSTGMPRIAAPESFKLITIIFLFNIIGLPIKYFILPSIALIATAKLDYKKNLTENERRSLLFVLFTGLLYLADHFILRSLSQYDFFGARILGFGLILIFSCLITYLFNFKKVHWIGVAMFIAISFFIAKLITIDNYNIPRSSASIFKNYDYIVSIKTASNSSQFVTANPIEYYGHDKKVLGIEQAPYYKLATLDSLKIKWKDVNLEKCVIDFSLIHNRRELDSIINAQYPIDKFPDKYAPNLSSDVKHKLQQIFKPNSLVPCNQIFK